MASKIDVTRTPGREIARIAGERVATMIACTTNRRLSTRHRIHAARTSGKKARAAIDLLRSADRSRSRRENRTLREVTRVFGVMRDADAMVATFDAVLAHYGLPLRPFDSIRAALLAHRHAVMPSPTMFERIARRCGAQACAVRNRLERWQPEAALADVARDFRRSYRRARRAMRRVERRPSPTKYHEWRKAVKTHYYQCRLLRAAWPAAMKAIGAELKALARTLGDEHDAAGLRAFVRQLAREDQLAAGHETTAAVRELLTAWRDERRATAHRLGARLFAEKPRVVAARLVGWWRVAAHG